MFEIIGSIVWAVVETILENPEVVVSVIGGISVLALASKFDFLKDRFRSVVRNWLRRTGERLKVVCLKIVRCGRQYKQTLTGITEEDTQKRITEKTLTEDEVLKLDIESLADGKEREVYNAKEILELQCRS